MNLLDHLTDILQRDKTNWERFRGCFSERIIPSKTTILREGEISQNLYFVK